jgi:hypothetical protein
MPKVVEDIEYLDSQEVMVEFDAPRKRFYSNIRPNLHPYTFDGKKKPWYKKIDVLALKAGKPVRKGSIPLLGGIQQDWTASLRSLGYNAETLLDKTDHAATLPEDAVEAFRLPADQKFFKRTRSTRVNGKPICTWSSYYPLEFVGDIIDKIEQGTISDIVKYIADVHHVVVGRATDKYTARITTFEEHTKFQLLNDEPVLILQRASYTRDKKTLVLYSDMVLLGSWFAPEHEYDVNIWG